MEETFALRSNSQFLYCLWCTQIHPPNFHDNCVLQNLPYVFKKSIINKKCRAFFFPLLKKTYVICCKSQEGSLLGPYSQTFQCLTNYFWIVWWKEFSIVISEILVIDHQTLPKRIIIIKKIWHLKISPMTAQGVSKYGPRNQSTETCVHNFHLNGQT